jgi:DNA-binding response OmpR family regulator
VLIVEDEQQAGDLLAHYLAEAGHRVARAATGEEAMTLARELKPDAITLDILLPGRDGHEVLARLKAAPETRDIPVVVVSITENQGLGLSLGAADWFVKPARRDDFVGAIRRALGNLPASRAATVLVVDDEPATVDFLTDLLTAQGFRVLTAHDGRQGIALALAHRPNVMVLDLVMPEVTGFDVVRELSRHAETRDIPILVFTVKDLTAEERESLKGSVKAIVMKGRGREHLLQELARVTTKASVDG